MVQPYVLIIKSIAKEDKEEGEIIIQSVGVQKATEAVAVVPLVVIRETAMKVEVVKGIMDIPTLVQAVAE